MKPVSIFIKKCIFLLKESEYGDILFLYPFLYTAVQFFCYLGQNLQYLRQVSGFFQFPVSGTVTVNGMRGTVASLQKTCQGVQPFVVAEKPGFFQKLLVFLSGKSTVIKELPHCLHYGFGTFLRCLVIGKEVLRIRNSGRNGMSLQHTGTEAVNGGDGGLVNVGQGISEDDPGRAVAAF